MSVLVTAPPRPRFASPLLSLLLALAVGLGLHVETASAQSGGGARLWIDGQVGPAVSGASNATWGLDLVSLGAFTGPDATTTGSHRFDDFASWHDGVQAFGDDFESGSLGAWSEVDDPAGRLAVNTSAPLSGSGDLVVLFQATTGVSRVIDDSPASPAAYSARFLFDLSDLTMAEGTAHSILSGKELGGLDIFRINLVYENGAYALEVAAREDDGGWLLSAPHLLDAGVTELKLDWWAGVPSPAVSAAFTTTCDHLTCTFDASGSSAERGIASYAWDLGDGTSATGASVQHTYSAAGPVQVALTVEDDLGTRDVARQEVEVAEAPPVAAFHFSCLGLECAFDAGDSSDDLGIASHSWSFDGAVGAGSTAFHAFPIAGTYQVTLTVADGSGQQAQQTWPVSVRDEAGRTWVDDELPAGALVGGYGSEGWIWDNTAPAPQSGLFAHHAPTADGIHQHILKNAADRLRPQVGDPMYAWVHLDPADLPRTVMLQWNSVEHGWAHRAVWGDDTLITWGVEGTDEHRWMGELPPAGGWVRLEVPAELVGVDGEEVWGMAFTLYDGKAAWDAAGMGPAAMGGQPVPEAFPGSEGTVLDRVAGRIWNRSFVPDESAFVAAPRGAEEWEVALWEGEQSFAPAVLYAEHVSGNLSSAEQRSQAASNGMLNFSIRAVAGRLSGNSGNQMVLAGLLQSFTAEGSGTPFEFLHPLYDPVELRDALRAVAVMQHYSPGGSSGDPGDPGGPGGPGIPGPTPEAVTFAVTLDDPMAIDCDLQQVACEDQFCTDKAMLESEYQWDAFWLNLFNGLTALGCPSLTVVNPTPAYVGQVVACVAGLIGSSIGNYSLARDFVDDLTEKVLDYYDCDCTTFAENCPSYGTLSYQLTGLASSGTESAFIQGFCHVFGGSPETGGAQVSGSATLDADGAGVLVECPISWDESVPTVFNADAQTFNDAGWDKTCHALAPNQSGASSHSGLLSRQKQDVTVAYECRCDDAGGCENERSRVWIDHRSVNGESVPPVTIEFTYGDDSFEVPIIQGNHLITIIDSGLRWSAKLISSAGLNVRCRLLEPTSGLSRGLDIVVNSRCETFERQPPDDGGPVWYPGLPWPGQPWIPPWQDTDSDDGSDDGPGDSGCEIVWVDVNECVDVDPETGECREWVTTTTPELRCNGDLQLSAPGVGFLDLPDGSRVESPFRVRIYATDADGLSAFAVLVNDKAMSLLNPSFNSSGGILSATVDLSGLPEGEHTLEVMVADAHPVYPWFTNVSRQVVVGTTPPPDPEPSAPKMRLFRNWDGGAIAAGSTVQYPSVEAGVSVSRAFRIDNVGDADLVLNSPLVDVSGACWSRIVDPPTPIGPGESGIFRIRLMCAGSATGGEKVGTVTVLSNDGNLSFQVRGTVLAAAPAVVGEWDGGEFPSGSLVDVSTPEGVAVERRFRLENRGDLDLDLAQPAALLSGSSCWTQTETPVSHLEPGESTHFTARLDCATPGVYSATVTLDGDGAGLPYTLSLRGEVVETIPDLVVTRNWDGLEVAEDSTFTFAQTRQGATRSYAFRLNNEGTGTLTLGSTSLVSGTCFSQTEAPAASIAPGTSTYFRVRLQCNSTGWKTATVTVPTNDPDSPFVFHLKGKVIASDVAVSRAWDGVAVGEGSTFDYGQVDVGVTSGKLFRITNSGTATLNLSNPTSLVSGTCWHQVEDPATAAVAPGASVTFRARLHCYQTGVKTATVSIASDDPDSPFTFSLRGTVVEQPPEVSVTRAWDGVAVAQGSTFDYGQVNTGVSISKLFRITNTGESTLDLSNPTSMVSGSCWSQIENPSTSAVAPGSSVTFRVRLYCTSAGVKTGTVTIASDDPTSPYTFYVRGEVLEPPPDVAISRAWDGVAVAQGSTYTYPDVEAGSSISRAFRITNTGTGTLYLSNPTSLVTGTCWQQVENPASTVAPGASTTFRVRLFCNSTGVKSATVRVYSNDPSSPYTFYLSGRVVSPPLPTVRVTKAWNGVAVAENSTFLFPTIATGTSVSRAFRIHNDGPGTLYLSSTSLVSGTCWSQIETPTATVAAGSSTLFRVRLMCGTAGTKYGTVTISSNEAGTPFRFYLQGTVQ